MKIITFLCACFFLFMSSFASAEGVFDDAVLLGNTPDYPVARVTVTPRWLRCERFIFNYYGADRLFIHPRYQQAYIMCVNNLANVYVRNRDPEYYLADVVVYMPGKNRFILLAVPIPISSFWGEEILVERGATIAIPKQDERVTTMPLGVAIQMALQQTAMEALYWQQFFPS